MDKERVSVARRAARAGAAVAAEGYRTGVAVETKAHAMDVVSRADHDAQAAVVDVIREADSDAAVVGEETGTLDAIPASGPAWVVDPIDGTTNYVRDIPVWASSVAAVVDGEPVAAATVLPAFEDEYVAGPDAVTRNGEPLSVSDRADPDTFVVAPTMWWDVDRREEYAGLLGAVVRRFGDLRRFGCAQATLAMVAAGSLEATVTTIDAHPWDTVAGVHMIERAGGVATDLDGERWTHDAVGLVASNGTRHDAVLAAARAAVDDATAEERSSG